MTTSPSNLRHWEALGHTDPAHTKAFQRAGGFRGTAIRPIESVRRMTEHFGPCGMNWGMEKPEFQLVSAGEELLIFCTVQLWYIEQEAIDAGCERAVVYGVGGDKVRVQQQRGLVNNDEAFKAAYTDALGNAMKHIGVAADVHMGLFDDSKYVREAAEAFKPKVRTRSTDGEDLGEFGSSRKLARKPSPKAAGEQLKAVAYDEASRGTDALGAFWSALIVDDKRAIAAAFETDVAGLLALLKKRAALADADIRQEEKTT